MLFCISYISIGCPLSIMHCVMCRGPEKEQQKRWFCKCKRRASVAQGFSSTQVCRELTPANVWAPTTEIQRVRADRKMLYHSICCQQIWKRFPSATEAWINKCAEKKCSDTKRIIFWRNRNNTPKKFREMWHKIGSIRLESKVLFNLPLDYFMNCVK